MNRELIWPEEWHLDSNNTKVTSEKQNRIENSIEYSVFTEDELFESGDSMIDSVDLVSLNSTVLRFKIEWNKPFLLSRSSVQDKKN